MTKKIHYKTIFVSDIHLGHLKNQSDKLIEFLNSISFENLIIVGDFIDYRQLKRFGRWTEKEEKALNYINNLSKNGVNITYIQGNHDRKLKYGKQIKIKNMSILKEMYYTTGKGKIYYVTHGDCMDGINNNLNVIGQLGSIILGLLLRIEHLWNKKTYKNSYISIAEKLEEWVKKNRMPENKINKKIIKFSKKLNCDGIILGHFHLDRHYEINGLDYFNTGDRLKHFAAVVEDNTGNLKLIHYSK